MPNRAIFGRGRVRRLFGLDRSDPKPASTRKGEPLLTMRRTTYSETGQPVELGDHIYRASLYSFEIVLITR